MITRLILRNYRCFQSLDLTLEPLTILVGPNASGKSSLLSALLPRVGQHGNGIAYDTWQHILPAELRGECFIELRFSDAAPSTFGLRNGIPSTPQARFSIQALRLDLNALRQSNTISHQRQLAPDGGNLASMFSTLRRSDQIELGKQLAHLVPVFQDVEFEPAPSRLGDIRLRFRDRWNDSVSYSPDQVSDGTMLLLAYLTLQFQDPPVDIVTVEEPERGLHPYLLGELMSFFRKLSRGEIGRKAIQVVLATHSAELLDHADPKEVRFLRRDPKTGGATVEAAPTDTPDWADVYRNYSDSMGSIWLSGGVGGVPGE